MRLNGNMAVDGQIKGLKAERLAADPSSPALSQVWFNTTAVELKYYDGVEIQSIAKGGNLDEYLRLDGTVPMTGELELYSDDQSTAAATSAVSKGHLDTVASTKQNNLTGATTSVTTTDLAVSKIVVSNASGKVAATANATSAEAEHLAGVSSNIQTQIDSKEPLIGYVPVNVAGDTMTGNLVMSNKNITGLAPASGATDPVRLQEFEAALSGLDFQPDVMGRQTDDTYDVTGHVSGDRFIVSDVAALHASFGSIPGVDNDDIVESDGTTFTIAYSVAEKGEGVLTWNQDTKTFQRYDGNGWRDFGGLAGVTAGIGLAKNNNDIYVNLGAGVKETPSDEVGLDLALNGGLMMSLDGSTPSVDTDAQVHIHADNSTIETDAGGLRVMSDGIIESHIATTALGDGLQGGSGVTLSVQTPSASGMSVDIDGVSIDDTEMRNRIIYRDGAEAMTGTLTLSSNDQSADTSTTAISKGHLDAEVSGLNDTIADLETRLVNGYFVYDGTGAASVAHTVTHNLGNKYVQVLVVDASDEIVIPESITYTDDNSLAVTFTSSETCRIVVTGLKAV